MQIRLASVDDIPAALELSNYWARHSAANFAIEPEALESWQEEWHETHELLPWFVAADQQDGVVGFAKASPWKGRCAYSFSAETSVYVHHDHHRGGIARALYGKLIATLRAQGYHTLIAGIATPNPASEHLHEQFGFHRVGVLERVGWKFDKWHDVGLWEAQLQGTDGAPAPLVPVRQALDR